MRLFSGAYFTHGNVRRAEKARVDQGVVETGGSPRGLIWSADRTASDTAIVCGVTARKGLGFTANCSMVLTQADLALIARP